MADGRPPVYYSDGLDPVQRSSPEQLFLITIEARPGPGAPEYGDAGGAYAADSPTRRTS